MNYLLTLRTILSFVWVVVFLIQAFLGLGTAYRKTKENGDNGVSLLGWIIVYTFSAMIPYLGIYYWKCNYVKNDY